MRSEGRFRAQSVFLNSASPAAGPPPRSRRVTRTGRRWRAALSAMALTFAGLAAGATSTAAADPSGSGVSETANHIPSTFQWSSSGPLISAKSDATHDIAAVKDPTVVRHNGKWLVYATTALRSGGWNLMYTSFEDWSEADSAPHYYLDQSAIGPGYRAAPQVFYFAPQKKWYLVYQTGLPSFSTTDDPTKPESWSAPRNFQEEMPDIIKENIGNGFWLDFWVTCDTAKCYLFSSDDNGHLYRSETTVADFPNGFGNTQIALQDSKFDLFEAANVYKIKGTDDYLLLVEAIGSDGRRYFRSWTSDSIDGKWTPLAASKDNPFARSNNVTFPDGAWTQDISHGEMIRSGVDQTMEIDPGRLRYLYQGMDPSASGDYNELPWKLGLLTETTAYGRD
ncbi:glycoside hydrolase [Streptomyces sp. PSKA54]|uniref:non-reducing end alpha-L-arabinofuranosidase n=1 Tax=Streptomyces himalayensis subsp. aureolus TaxID=2758039 RepID=A0A7W2D743_9ACTN|nr:glycoside hydrolase [Streptomyces himalayensis subsp. aureolus]